MYKDYRKKILFYRIIILVILCIVSGVVTNLVMHSSTYKMEGFIGIGILVVAIVILIIHTVLALRLKHLKDRINYGDYEEYLLINDYLKAKNPNKNIRVGALAVYIYRGGGSTLIYNKDIVWAYVNDITRVVNGIKTNEHNYVLVIYCKNGGGIHSNIKKNEVENVLLQIGANCPWAIIGYDDVADNLIRNGKMDKLLERKYNKYITHGNQLVQNVGWTCKKCGKSNPAHIGTCACGGMKDA